MTFVVSSHPRRGGQADPNALEDMAQGLRAGMGKQGDTVQELEHCPCACHSLGPVFKTFPGNEECVGSQGTQEFLPCGEVANSFIALIIMNKYQNRYGGNDRPSIEGLVTQDREKKLRQGLDTFVTPALSWTLRVTLEFGSVLLFNSLGSGPHGCLVSSGSWRVRSNRTVFNPWEPNPGPLICHVSILSLHCPPTPKTKALT